MKVVKTIVSSNNFNGSVKMKSVNICLYHT